MSQPAEATYVAPEDLHIGLYVHLDLSWMQHPFPTSSFKIRSRDQITTIQGLGLRRIRCAPELSDGSSNLIVDTPDPLDREAGLQENPSLVPHPLPAREAPAPQEAPRATSHELMRAAQIAQRRAALKACERELAEAARNFKSITRNVYAQPAQSRELATEMIHKLGSSLLSDADITLHLMAEKVGGEVIYHHALNVTLLSMLLARAMKAPPAMLPLIGLGALFHDIGKIDIPDRIWRKAEAPSKAELAWIQQHAAGGVEIARKMGLAPEAQVVISQHHEMVDGSGYPKKLKGTQISLPARIVAVTNAYDNLCNPMNPAQALTPHEALSAMFSLQRAKFDEKVLATFVKCMGIYPPGTIVSLSDGSTGMVVAVNEGQALRPVVLLHDPTASADAAVTVDLEDIPELSIRRTIKACELDACALMRLAPYGRMTYYFNTHGAHV